MNLIDIYSENKKIKTLSFKNGSYLIGSEANDIQLNYPTVSRTHGRITFSNESMEYEDLESKNGSLINGLRIQPRKSFSISESDNLKIALFDLRFRRLFDEVNPISFSDKIQKYSSLFIQLINQGGQGGQGGQSGQNPREQFFDLIDENEFEKEKIISVIYREYYGDGPLEDFLKNPQCREILVNKFNEIYADLGCGSGLVKTDECFLSEKSYASWVARTAERLNRRIDLQNPICEGTFEDGSRFHAVLDCASNRGIAVAIRRFQSSPTSESIALSSGWLDESALQILKTAIVSKKNIVVSGGTSTGKTSLLNFLCRYLPPNERIITIEDTIELTPPVQNLVQLQSRRPNAEGAGEIDLRKLVQCALRMRPDRIIVGECRGEEVLEMLQALNTGHPGSMTTLHANSPNEALQRLELLALLHAPNLNIESLKEWIRMSLHLIVQVDRSHSGKRYVQEIWSLENGSAKPVYSRRVD